MGLGCDAMRSDSFVCVPIVKAIGISNLILMKTKAQTNLKSITMFGLSVRMWTLLRPSQLPKQSNIKLNGTEFPIHSYRSRRAFDLDWSPSICLICCSTESIHSLFNQANTNSVSHRFFSVDIGIAYRNFNKMPSQIVDGCFLLLLLLWLEPIWVA